MIYNQRKTFRLKHQPLSVDRQGPLPTATATINHLLGKIDGHIIDSSVKPKLKPLICGNTIAQVKESINTKLADKIRSFSDEREPFAPTLDNCETKIIGRRRALRHSHGWCRTPQKFSKVKSRIHSPDSSLNGDASCSIAK